MPIRLSGLASGLDTEAIVESLVSAYSYKKDKYVKAQTKLSWKQDAWKTLNSKVYSLYTSVGNMRYSSNYALKKVTVSDSTKANVTASGTAVNGTQTLKISNLAKTGYLTGGELSESITADSSLTNAGYSFKDEKGTIDVTANGKTTSFTVNKDMTISEFVDELNNAGVSASFDENNHRIFISATSSGADGDFTLSAGDAGGFEALSALGLVTSTDASSYKAMASLAKYNSSNKYDATSTKEYITEGVNAIYQAYLSNKEGTMTNDALSSVLSTYSDIASYAKSYYSVESASDWLAITDIASFADKMYKKVDGAARLDISSDARANRVNGEDATFILNGATFTSDSNSLTVNGLTIQALATTTSEMTITTSTDTSGIYDKIKDFLSSYNSLINEMQSLYNADSAKDYEPLTDDEKAEMSETEIEKWEQKIKDSLLRRDTTLSGLISTMTNSMMATYEINGKTYSWSSFGVHTLGTLNAEANENYAYHIDGDSEDSYTSGKEDKLLAALAEDPDSVIEFMKQMTSGLYNELDTKMKSSAVKSVYTVYNDKEMASEYSDYTSIIKTWTTRIEDMEDAYYKKFAAMESALAQLQSNSSSLSSMLGG